MSQPAVAQDTQSLDSKFVNAFLMGAMKTFKVQCSCEIKPQRPHILEKSEVIPSDICGVIGLTSKVFCGSITLCFSEKIFLEVMGGMFGEAFSEITDELSDGAGELLNIIFGTAKTILNDEGLAVEKAIPTVIRGKGVKVSSVTHGGATIVVPLEAKFGQLHVLVSLGDPVKELK